MEIVADAGVPLSELIDDLQKMVGPVYYKRDDIRLDTFITKKEMVDRLVANTPKSIAGESVVKVDSYDGVKYHMADDSWLLIRPSGTEPVLRVYAEASNEKAIKEMLVRERRKGKT